MLKFWDIGLDERRIDLRGPDWREKSVVEMSREGGVMESYYAGEFAKKIGRNSEYTLEDSWKFYRDMFVVVDNSFFDLFGTKLPAMSEAFTSPLHECVNYSFWQRLYSRRVDIEWELRGLDIEALNWDFFYNNKQLEEVYA